MVEWSIFNEIFAVAFNVLYFVIIIGTIFIVILDNRNPVKTMAWVLVLFFLPIVGLVFYFFFGRSTRKEKLISKKGFTRLIKRPMAEYQAQKAFKCPDEQHQLMRFFRKVNNALPFEGNATEVFTDGYSMLYSLMKEISKAKHHIHLQFYIFEDDPAGRLLRDLLIDKARQGVEVRLLYDDVGCWKVPHAFFDEMRGAGIEARSFLKVRFPLFTSKVNYRNHRKIVVIDGRVAYTGGMNIALRYMKGFPWGIWRDTHMDEGENVLSMVITGDYSGFMLFFFASGKCAKIPLSSYATKQNRRKLLKAYSDKEPLAMMLYQPEETELAIRTSASRMLLVGTAQIAAKTTRDSQGVAVVTLKKNQTIASVVPADTLELANPHRYRVRSLPATGALIRAEDEGEQMSLL